MQRKYIILLLFPFLLFGTEKKDCCVFLPPAKPCQLYNCVFYANVSFLYWQAKEDGLEYAIKNSNPDTGLDGKVVDPNFSFEPAFRLALGFYLPHDCWDVSFYYTRFESKSKDDDTSALNEPISSAGRGLIPVWVHPAAFGGSLNDVRWANAKATWKIRYNVIDARLGKDFCVNCILALNPYFGLKNGIIHQNFNVSYRNGNVVFIDNSSVTPIATDVALKNFSYGIGPLLGLASSWRIGCSWSFFTNLSFSLLHTRFNLARIENDLSTQIINGQTRNDRAEFSEKYWTYKPQAELAIGIRWDKCFGCSSHLGIGAAYEGSYWWKQNQMPRFIDANIEGKTRNTLEDLFLHGLTVDLRFDF